MKRTTTQFLDNLREALLSELMSGVIQYNDLENTL